MTITIADGRGALWQWDTGRRVKITGDDGVKQIHYQNRVLGRSVDVDVGADGTAIIPDELLQDCHTLTAYAYVTDDAGGYTKVQQDFAVYKRAKPADYVYTPTEHAGFGRLRAEIGELSALTTSAKDSLVSAINEAAASASWNELKDKPFYLEKTLFIELTKDDFVLDNEGRPFYTSSPKLDWMTSIDTVSIELNLVYNDGTSYAITENSPGIYFETIREDDGREYVNFGDDENFDIYSGPEDSFSIKIWDSYENFTEIHLALYRKYVKKIPSIFVDAAIGKTALNIMGWNGEDVFVEVPEINIPVHAGDVSENEVYYDTERECLKIPAKIMPWNGTCQIILNYALSDTVGKSMIFSLKEGDAEWEYLNNSGNCYIDLLFFFIPSGSFLSFIVRYRGSKTVTALATSEAGYVYCLKYTYSTDYKTINGYITRII